MNDDNEHGAEVATNEEPQHSPNPVDPETIQHEGPEAVAPEERGKVVVQPPKKRFHLPSIRPESILPKFVRAKLGRAARYIAIASMVIIVAGAGASAWWASGHFGWRHAKPVSRFTASVEPFRVVSTTPGSDQSDVTDGTKIIVTFSRPVDPARLNGDFFVSPEVAGTYAAGDSANQAVFTPDTPFPDGTIVSVMIHGEFQSLDGSQLGPDYSFSYTMATPSNGVVLQRDGYNEVAGSVAEGTDATYTLFVGTDVDPKGTVTVYKTDMPALLKALVYHGSSNAGQDFASTIVDTSAMQQVQTHSGLKDNDNIVVHQGAGVYAIVATSKGEQAGYAWLVVSNFGVVARQDDQRLVLASQNYATGQSEPFKATVYNLQDSVHEVTNADIDGSGSVDTPFSTTTDVVTAEASDGQIGFIPLHEYLSLADMRAKRDLSATDAIYGLADKPSYTVNDTVQFAGFVRQDNDAHYAIPASGSMAKLYVATSQWGDHLADLTVPVSANGVIDGHITVGSNFIGSDGSDQQLYIFDSTGDPFYDQPIASFTATKAKPSLYAVKVAFGKPSYIASDTITATITATDQAGAPVAGAKAAVSIFTKDYYEGDVRSNQASQGYTGDLLKGSPMTVQLDSSGHAVVSIDVSKFPSGSSKTVTVQAGVTDKDGHTAGGGASATVHEGNAVLTFGTGRTLIPSGGQLVGRVYATTLDGGVLANATIDYTVTANTYDNSSSGNKTSSVATGNVTTDANGYAVVTVIVPVAYAKADYLTLAVSTSDAANNKVSASQYYYIQSGSGSGAFSDLQLANLDISGSATDVQVGQTMNLTINSAKAVRALVTVERGRIYKSEVVDLHAGDNSYSVNVTPDLAPSFMLAFSYIHDGVYNVEGASYNVSASNKQGVLAISTNKAQFAANDMATINVTATDAQHNPLATNVILGIVDANVFNLNNQVTPDMFTFLYSPREMTTNGSSSLTGLGSGGGKCGGGGWDQPGLENPLGKTVLWNPRLMTTVDGTGSAQVKLPKGTWRVYAYSMSDDSIVSSNYITVKAQ